MTSVHTVPEALLSGSNLPFYLFICLAVMLGAHGVVNVDTFHKLLPKMGIERQVSFG